jgi:hypothetical protein
MVIDDTSISGKKKLQVQKEKRADILKCGSVHSIKSSGSCLYLEVTRGNESTK